MISVIVRDHKHAITAGRDEKSRFHLWTVQASPFGTFGAHRKEVGDRKHSVW